MPRGLTPRRFTGSDAAFLLLLTGISAVDVIVEVYNYTYGTSYLRLEFGGRSQ